MSESLIIFPANDNNELDYKDLIKSVSSINGVCDTFYKKESKHSSFTGFYQYNNEKVIFDVGKIKPFVSITGLTEAPLNFALELQKVSPVSLAATNDDYSFSCNLESISSTEEFRKIISQGIHMNEQ